MRVVVTYNQFNTQVISAEIVADTVEDAHGKFEFTVVEDLVMPENNKLKINVSDESELNNIALEMTAAEVKQFSMLMSQFAKSL